MPSRADRRPRLEQALRGIVMAILAVMLWRSLRQSGATSAKNLSTKEVSARKLAEWSGLPAAPSVLQLEMDSVPSPVDRAWLGALAGAGTNVRWKARFPAFMIDAQPIASPTGGTTMRVASPQSAVVLSDDAGPLDTLRVTNAGATVYVGDLVGGVTARVAGATASTVPRDSVVLHRVLVVGSAGWESKFVTAALEEAGWKVDASIRIAPAVSTTQGAPSTIDTARYSAVIALDAAAAPYASRIADFVGMGGGVVLAPQAASLDAMAVIRAGAVGRVSSSSRKSPSESVTRLTLAASPIAPLRNDAVVLESRGGAPTVVARRIGAGRVVQSGYEDTWRWRMTGGDGAVRDYRVWWTRLVSSIAYAPRIPRQSIAVSTDEAPTAAFVAAVGPSPARAPGTIPSQPTNWWPLLFILLALTFLSEIGSRRLRGAS